MQRIKISLPKNWQYFTEIKVRITDLNYGNHLANDKLLSLIHETRVRFLQEYGQTEIDFFSSGLIQADSQIIYKNQAFLGDILTCSLSLDKPSRIGFNIFYLIKKGQKEIARAKTAMAFFDYRLQKLSPPSKDAIEFFAKILPKS